jgi:hypothetical protein
MTVGARTACKELAAADVPVLPLVVVVVALDAFILSSISFFLFSGVL